MWISSVVTPTRVEPCDTYCLPRSLIIEQHATTSRDITWAVSAGAFKWMGTEPTWSSDAVSAIRIVTWRYDGAVMYLAATDVAA